MGQPWRGDYVFNSGNLILDLLHNFFLEDGARTHKLRVYELTDNPAARQMLGYLFVRGGVHAHAYALALEQLTGVEMKKMLPIRRSRTCRCLNPDRSRRGASTASSIRFSPEDYTDAAGRQLLIETARLVNCTIVHRVWVMHSSLRERLTMKQQGQWT